MGSVLFPSRALQAVIALKKRIDAASSDFGCNVAVRAVEWHSRMHRVRGWEREVSRVSLTTIADLRQGIKDVLGDCFLFLSPRWHDILISEVGILHVRKQVCFYCLTFCDSVSLGRISAQ